MSNPADRSPPGSPPAVWTSFARASAWKSWVLIVELGVIALLLLTNLRLAAREPDVVTIAPDGKSTYLGRSVAGDALLKFLAEQKGTPPDVAVLHFTAEFLNLFLGANSSTIHAAWPKALTFMTPGLRAKFERAGKAQQLVENLERAQVRTEVTVKDIEVLERTEGLLHLRATVTREKSRLADATSPESDALEIDLVLKVVARSATRPDGLEIVDLETRAKDLGSAGAPLVTATAPVPSP
jgi:hypothetical protein